MMMMMMMMMGLMMVKDICAGQSVTLQQEEEPAAFRGSPGSSVPRGFFQDSFPGVHGRYIPAGHYSLEWCQAKPIHFPCATNWEMENTLWGTWLSSSCSSGLLLAGHFPWIFPTHFE